MVYYREACTQYDAESYGNCYFPVTIAYLECACEEQGQGLGALLPLLSGLRDHRGRLLVPELSIKSACFQLVPRAILSWVPLGAPRIMIGAEFDFPVSSRIEQDAILPPERCAIHFIDFVY